VPTYRALMEETDWDKYGTGKYEKCAECMVHCGYEATAVMDTIAHPIKALRTFVSGPELDGPMAAEIPLENQRPAEYIFDSNVQKTLTQLHAEAEQRAKERSDAA